MGHEATQTPAEVARRAFAAFVAGGMRAGAAAGYAPDIVFVDLPEFPDGGEHSGRDAAVDHLERFFAAWQDPTIEVTDVIEAGDRAAVRFWLIGKGLSSGVDMRSELWHVCTVRAGAIVRIEAYSSEPEALAALNG